VVYNANRRRSRTLHLGHDDLRFCWRRLHGLSSEVEASFDGRLIYDHQINSRAAFGRLFFWSPSALLVTISIAEIKDGYCRQSILQSGPDRDRSGLCQGFGFVLLRTPASAGGLFHVRPWHYVCPSGTTSTQVSTFIFVIFGPEQISVLPRSAMLDIRRHMRTVILLANISLMGQVNSNGE
jgi:hypothetical protein